MPYISLKVSKDLYDELGMCPNMELMRSKADGGVKFLPLSNVLNHVFGEYRNYISPLLTSPLFGNRPVTKEVSTEIDPEIISNELAVAENITDGASQPQGTHQESVESSISDQVSNSEEDSTTGEHSEVEIHTNQSCAETMDLSEELSLQDVELPNASEYLYESASESSHQEFFMSQPSALVDQVSLGQEVIVGTSSSVVVGSNCAVSTSAKNYSDSLNGLMRLDSELDFASEFDNVPENMSPPSPTPISASLALKKNHKEKRKKQKISNLINPKSKASGNKRATNAYPKQCENCLKFYKSKGSFFAHKKICARDNVDPKPSKKRIILKCPKCSLDFSSALVHQIHVSNCKRKEVGSPLQL